MRPSAAGSAWRRGEWVCEEATPLTVSWELSQARRAQGHTDVLCEPIVGQGGKHKRGLC